MKAHDRDQLLVSSSYSTLRLFSNDEFGAKNLYNTRTSPDVNTSFLSSETTIRDAPPKNGVEPEANSRVPEPWWSNLVSDYRPLEASKLPPDVIFGASFTTFTIDPTVYLPYLLDKIQELGGRVFRSKLPIDGGIEAATTQAATTAGLDPYDEPIWAVVNATGLAAKDMVDDQNMYPIRGQTVRVKGVAKEVTTRLGATKSNVAAVMPRPGSNCTVVGVTVEQDVWKTDIEEDKVKMILDRARAFAPELVNEQGDYEVLKVGVGLRPGRRGGARVDLEKCPSGLVIAHTYGHAGAG